MNGEKVIGIILAGGKSQRFRDADKLTTMLSNKQLIAYSIEEFDISHLFSNIILVARKEKESIYQKIINNHCKYTPSSVVKGGESRQISVYNALLSMKSQPDIVLIHDGARPFVNRNMLYQVIEAARKYGGASLGIHPKDLIKIDNGNGYVKETIKKRLAWLVQTPQAFCWNPLINAHKAAFNSRDFTYEDDASLLEALEIPIKMIEGKDTNIKVTTPEDLLIAEQIIQNIGT